MPRKSRQAEMCWDFRQFAPDGSKEALEFMDAMDYYLQAQDAPAGSAEKHRLAMKARRAMDRGLKLSRERTKQA